MWYLGIGVVLLHKTQSAGYLMGWIGWQELMMHHSQHITVDAIEMALYEMKRLSHAKEI